MGNKISLLRHDLGQIFWLPPPPLTEHNLSDQTGKVYIVTGGYAGVGLELASLLYRKNATVYIAGRSKDKGQQALDTLKRKYSSSTGGLHFLLVDLADLSSIKSATQDFLDREQRLHVLWNNAGVMFPPKGSRTVQEHELQMGTNCLGPWLFTKLLTPILEKTAAASPANTVRVAWAGSIAIDAVSPTGGVAFDSHGSAKCHDQSQTDYGQTKAGNLFMASEYGKQHPSIVSVCFNPGNLKSELQRYMSGIRAWVVDLTLHPAIYGGYTELYCGCSDELTTADNGRYISPWGRKSHVRDDITLGLKSKEEGGSGVADRFVTWADKEVELYV